MYSYINVDTVKVNSECKLQLEMLQRLYLKHKFNLFGSGYVKIGYEIVAKGFHGRKYVDRQMILYGKVAERRLKRKCTNSYEPINWFVDYKSGFFFSPFIYSSQASCYKVMCEKEGVDIKCPWELSRFYHLVQLSVLAIADEVLRESIILEFKDEMIDFIEMNPVGKTVQWSAPMDISIRIVNILLAYDILMQLDIEEKLDRKFQVFFEKHISESLKFVMNHLEYNRIGTNHYLSNIAGIIFASAYLPENEWTDACLVFGVQELIDQVGKQFNEDGSHFEGSTSYHRLSTEFVLYSTALIYGILKTKRKNVFFNFNHGLIKRLKCAKLQKYNLFTSEFFPEHFINKLYNAGIFTKTILKSNNEIVQIGDNDSGRLLKLTPLVSLNDKKMEENVLDHRTLLSALYGIFLDDEFVKSKQELPLESSLIQSLSKNKKIRGKRYTTYINEYGNRGNVERKYQYLKKNIIFQSDRDNLLEGVKAYYFDKFGIVVLKGDRLFLSIVIDTTNSGVYFGHTHNDKLSIEVMVDDKYITRDPGGYIYTPSPRIRDSFRSIKAHNTICIEGYEQNIFNGIWGMKKRAKAELLYCTKDRVLIEASYGDIECLRDIEIMDYKIIIKDYANKPFHTAFRNKIYSDGYGKLKRVNA